MIRKVPVHYEITNRIGKIRMGGVYQAKDPKHSRDVAIRMLPELIGFE